MEKTSWWPQSYSTSLIEVLPSKGWQKRGAHGCPLYEFVMSRSSESFVSTLWLVKPLELHFPSRDDDGAGNVHDHGLRVVNQGLTRDLLYALILAIPNHSEVLRKTANHFCMCIYICTHLCCDG